MYDLNYTYAPKFKHIHFLWVFDMSCKLHLCMSTFSICFLVSFAKDPCCVVNFFIPRQRTMPYTNVHYVLLSDFHHSRSFLFSACFFLMLSHVFLTKIIIIIYAWHISLLMELPHAIAVI